MPWPASQLWRPTPYPASMDVATSLPADLPPPQAAVPQRCSTPRYTSRSSTPAMAASVLQGPAAVAPPFSSATRARALRQGCWGVGGQVCRPGSVCLGK